jgi:hypothetical protein
VYFLLGGSLFVVHEVLGQWVDAEGGPRPRPSESGAPSAQDEGVRPSLDRTHEREQTRVEHWLVVASMGRFGTPGVFRLQRRLQSVGPDMWSVRAERR